MSKKIIDIKFIPGSFDDFDGTQEELNDFIAEIKNMALSGELEEQATEIDLQELKETEPHLYEILMKKLSTVDKRKLN